jgi:hypothetical protein
MNWNKEELRFLRNMDEPIKIQSFLNSIDYNPDPVCKSPRWVIRKQSAHCFEGALFAAACLQQIGYIPLLVDLKAFNDDDHVIAVYKRENCWGAIAKSNFNTLRFREPVYRSLRELAMSYYDFYFNILGNLSLRSYSSPLNLAQYNSRRWTTSDDDLEYIGDKLEKLHHFPVIPDSIISKLNKVDSKLLNASLIGSNEAGLFVPEKL